MKPILTPAQMARARATYERQTARAHEALVRGFERADAAYQRSQLAHQALLARERTLRTRAQIDFHIAIEDGAKAASAERTRERARGRADALADQAVAFAERAIARFHTTIGQINAVQQTDLAAAAARYREQTGQDPSGIRT